MFAEAAFAQIGFADIPNFTAVIPPLLGPTNLLASKSVSQLFGTELSGNLSGGTGPSQLTGIDSVANLIGSKRVDQLN